MDFPEKLKKLRISKNLTQEELANALFVSRTAISKWESGRGYPSIESLREISDFFSVTIDDLLSSENLLTIAVKENKTTIRNMCNFFFAIADLFSVILIFLPLYPENINGFICTVSLLSYNDVTQSILIVHWIMFILLFITGVLKLIFTKIENEKANKIITDISVIINILIVLFLALAREAYAVVASFFLLIIKVITLFKHSAVGK